MRVAAPGFRIRASTGVVFSPTGEYLASVGKAVTLWSVAERERVRSSTLLPDPSGVAFSPSGARFVVKNTGGDLVACDTATADPLASYKAEFHDEGPDPVFHDETHIIDGSWEGRIRVRSIEDLRPGVLWGGTDAMVTAVLRAPDAWLFAINAKATPPDFAAGADYLLSSPDPLSREFAVLPRRWPFLRSCALSPAGDRLALRHGAREHELEVVEVGAWETIGHTGITQGGTGWGLTWAPDGNLLVTVEKGGFSFRSAADLREVGWLPSQFAADVAFSPSGDLIALADWKDGLVHVWPDLLSGLRPR